MTYRFDAFMDLKQLFDQVGKLYKVSSPNYAEILSALPISVREYLNSVSFLDKLEEINCNSSTAESFRKRFYQVFDAFQVLKFMNQAHEQYYAIQSLEEAISQLREAEKAQDPSFQGER